MGWYAVCECGIPGVYSLFVSTFSMKAIKYVVFMNYTIHLQCLKLLCP